MFRYRALLLLSLSVTGAILGCTGKGRRNDLRPLSEGSFDEEYQQHIVITDDSIKPFEMGGMSSARANG